MSEPLHFYLVFNPLLNNPENSDWSQAHDFYLQLKNSIEQGLSDHLYWGKCRLDKNIPALDISKLQSIHGQNVKNGRNTHLFISDFNSLWVGKVEAIEDRIKDFDLTLPFYKGKDVEVWFKISDMILVADGSMETNEFLHNLSLDHEFSKEKQKHFNPYQYGLRYPIILRDPQDMDFFGLGSELLVTQHDPQIFHKGSKKVLANLHSYTIPKEFFSRLPKLARNEILSSELEIFSQKFISPLQTAKSYTKALELTLSDLFVWHLKKNISKDDNISIDLRGESPKFLSALETPFQSSSMGKDDKILSLTDNRLRFSLYALFSFIESKDPGAGLNFEELFRDRRDFFFFLRNDFKKTVKKFHLDGLSGIREGSQQAITKTEALAIRNLVLGVGCYGLLNQLIASYYNYEVGNIFMKKEGSQPSLAA